MTSGLDLTRSLVIPRRAFLASLGIAAGGLALGLGPAANAAPADDTFSPNVFVHIAPDGRVTILSHRTEMGQGVKSTLPALIADELGADMAHVTILQADGDKKYGDQNTDGSSSVRKGYDELRRVGAGARILLTLAAAKKWNVDAKACNAHDHAVFHMPSKRSLGFGELSVLAAKLGPQKLDEIAFRPLSELHHVFGPLPLVDGPDIVTGRSIYGADVRVPGMLTAVIARPPALGGRVASVDTKAALAVSGVKRVFQIAAPTKPPGFQPLGGVVVVADTTWAAMRGRAALAITWKDGDTYDSVAYRAELLAAVRAPGQVVRKTGDVDAALAKSARRVVAEYHVPHLAHAPMEPPAAVARVENGSCEVWTSTQNPQAAREEVAKALGLDQAHVTIHVTLTGGGFGRKSKPDYVVEAALASREMGAPVRLQWTREDDVRHDYFHTTSAQRLEAGLDDRGKVTAWLHRTAFPSISSTFKADVKNAGVGELQQGVLDFPLAIPNVRCENGEAIAHTRIGWLRSVCNIHHAFAIGSFIDEVAHERGMDPRDAWLEIVGAPRIVGETELGVDKLPNYGQPLKQHPVDTARLRHVIERATKLAGWDGRKQSGRALGLSAHRSFLTYVAVVASVVRDAQGKARVDEAWIVADAGTVVNPDRAISQMEGAVVFGMSLAFTGAITMRGGAVEQSNFYDYRIVRMPKAPRAIHVEIVASEGPPGGIGEPGLPPVAPAIANAVFALTGVRARELPLSKSGLV